MSMRIRMVLAVWILPILLVACSSPKQLEYRNVEHIQLKELSLQPKIGMDIILFNPNNFGVTLKDADIAVYLNEKHVGNAVLDGKTIVPGLDSFAVPVVLNADLRGIFNNAFAILSNKELDVRLQGNVKAGKGVFINVPVNYRGRKKLNVLDF